MADDYRTESDSLGEMDVPADAYWGAQTQRAVENFPISGISFSRRFVRALGIVKKAAAQANRDLGLVDDEIAQAIIDAANEVIAGDHDDQTDADDTHADADGNAHDAGDHEEHADAHDGHEEHADDESEN